jgi:hypothetical protein
MFVIRERIEPFQKSWLGVDNNGCGYLYITKSKRSTDQTKVEKVLQRHLRIIQSSQNEVFRMLL